GGDVHAHAAHLGADLGDALVGGDDLLTDRGDHLAADRGVPLLAVLGAVDGPGGLVLLGDAHRLVDGAHRGRRGGRRGGADGAGGARGGGGGVMIGAGGGDDRGQGGADEGRLAETEPKHVCSSVTLPADPPSSGNPPAGRIKAGQDGTPPNYAQ